MFFFSITFREGMKWHHQPFCLFCWATQLEAPDIQFDIEGREYYYSRSFPLFT